MSIVFCSAPPSNKAENDETSDEATENTGAVVDKDVDWEDMTSHNLELDHWIKDGTRKKKIHPLIKPIKEPKPNANKVYYCRYTPRDAKV
jgi:hypothetical protein